MLYIFSQASGLKINFGKSSIVPFNFVVAWSGCYVPKLTIPANSVTLYIFWTTSGNRSLIGKLEKELMAGWKEKAPSREGRHVLVNIILLAIPAYFMIYFKLSKWVIKRLDQIRRAFLWMNMDRNRQDISLLNYESVCLLKKVGDRAQELKTA
jgi:hypothetical protein